MLPLGLFYSPSPAANNCYYPNHFQICYFAQIPLQYQGPNPINSNSQAEPTSNSQFSWKSLQTHPGQLDPPARPPLPPSPALSEDSALLAEPGARRARGAKQKFGRNILSNIFLMMVRFVQKSKKMKAHVLKLIEANKLTIKINEFYNIIKRKASKLKPYANEANIAAFWRDPPLPQQPNPKEAKEREFAYIFRIVGRIYLTTYHIPYVYNTNKIKGESKKLHMGYVRKILAF